jgi:hypothetical protein
MMGTITAMPTVARGKIQKRKKPNPRVMTPPQK